MSSKLELFPRQALEEASKLLLAYEACNGKFKHPYFANKNVTLRITGDKSKVFLSDDDNNVLVLSSDGSLEGVFFSFNHRGTFQTLCEEWDETWSSKDSKWLVRLAKYLDKLDVLPTQLKTK